MMLMAGSASGDSSRRVPHDIFRSIQDSFTTHLPTPRRPPPRAVTSLSRDLPTVQPEPASCVKEVCGAHDALRIILQ